MLEPGIKVENGVVMEKDGRLVFSEKVMADFVLATAGADLRFNEKDGAVGVKLLRGEDNPRFPIERESGADGGVRGVLQAGPFLAKLGIDLNEGPFVRPCLYFKKFHMLVVPLQQKPQAVQGGTKNILDDYPALED